MTSPLSFSYLRIVSVALVGLTLIFAGPVESGEMVQLESAIQEAVAILHDSSLDSPEKKAERQKKLRDVILKEFDFYQMSRGSVGKKWRRFSKSQQNLFVPLFRQLLENTYLGAIDRFKDGSVRFVSEVKQSKRVVLSESVVTTKGKEFKMAYRLHWNGKGWKVFDVVIEGVSVVANYRAQFRQLLWEGTKADIDQMLERLKTAAEKSEG